jgi:hypothetical protein
MSCFHIASTRTKFFLAGALLSAAVSVGWVSAAARGTGYSAGDKLTPFIAVLNSGQETAQPASTALGVAFLVFNETTDELNYNISYQGLVAAEIASHIHGPAGPGENASPILDFMDLSNPKNGTFLLDSDQENFLKKGLLYVNIHTDPAGGGFSGGEIRGQILPVKAKYKFVGAP